MCVVFRTSFALATRVCHEKPTMEYMRLKMLHTKLVHFLKKNK